MGKIGSVLQTSLFALIFEVMNGFTLSRTKNAQISTKY
jgi:hypothetical protein